MTPPKTALIGILILATLVPALSEAAQETAKASATQAQTSPTPRPLDLQAALAWRYVAGTAVANNGSWLMTRQSPNEGDGEVVLRALKGDKEHRFPAGEAPAPSYGDRARDLAISEDSKWAAFLAYPEAKEAKKLRKDKKEPRSKAVIVDLATGEKAEFESVRSFAFAGERAGWIALQKYGLEGQDKEKNKATGADLVLRELASGKELNIGNVAEYAFNKSGRWLAWIIDAREQAGNGLQLRDMASGVVTPLDSDKATYKSMRWTEEGDGLAALKGKEDKGYEDMLYGVVGFTGFGKGAGLKSTAYDPGEDKAFPVGMTISPDRAPRWTEDLTALLFGIREPKKKEGDATNEGKKEDKKDEAAPKEPAAAAKPDDIPDEDIPDLILWHWKDSRLQSQQQVEEKRDAAFSYLSLFRAADRRFVRLADDSLREVEVGPKDRTAIGFDRVPYELEGNLDGRHFQDVYIVDLATGSRRLAVKGCRWYFGPSPDGTRLLYFDQGHFHTLDMSTGTSRNITEGLPVSFVNHEDDHNVQDQPYFPHGWVKVGASVLLSDGWDIWKVPAGGGPGAVALTTDGRKDGIRYRRPFILDPDDKGFDLSKPLYVPTYGEWTKKAGYSRIDKGRPRATALVWEDASFGMLLKAKKAETYVFSRATNLRYGDLYAADAALGAGRRLTDVNPQQKDFLWSSGSLLLDYESIKGDKLQAALFLPANYEKGKRYPCIVYIYEKLSQGLNQYTVPSASGFNRSVYTSNGYAVLTPDITYKINDPGMSAVWCVLPAIEAAVDSGVVDKARVGLQGHSWGGYQTAFLVTQTNAFAAAVAGAPLTNMISMYSSIYWNSGSANQPIFESSQGRFKGGYWDNIEAYTRNSPVYWAKNVTAPLVILHNDKDGAVDWNQGIEYYNTLRRLGKPVVMLEYVGENHGLRKPANQKDYGVRMREFFDHLLMGKPAPQWYVDGISYLKLKDHLKDRAKELQKK